MGLGAEAGTTGSVLMQIFKQPTHHCEERLRRSNPVLAASKVWIASLSLAMTWQESTFSRRHAPEVCKKFLQFLHAFK